MLQSGYRGCRLEPGPEAPLPSRGRSSSDDSTNLEKGSATSNAVVSRTRGKLIVYNGNSRQEAGRPFAPKMS